MTAETTLGRKLIVLVFGLAVGALLLSILGGSMIWILGGAHGLDVDGTAAPTARPADTIDIGNGWRHYGGDSGGHRYSKARQITADNVDRLAPVWEYRNGDMTARAAHMGQAATEGTPILVDDSLVFCTPFNEVIALDPGTGTERWRFDAGIDLDQDPANQFVCRGVAHWRDADTSMTCASRIFMGTNDARLIAINAATGNRCAGFGVNGEVRIDPGMPLVWPGEFQITSPPVTLGDTVVVGSAIGDNARVAAPAGSLRAFDTRTGAPRWEWDPIPRAASDPAATGSVRWSFQTVHHDVWDYDLPAQPGLYSVWRDGRRHDVVAQVTKTGLVFVLDRDTGEPFLPVEERSVPQAGAAGEWLSPTQPFPVATPPVVPNRLSPDDAFGLTWFDRRHCRGQIEDALADGCSRRPPSGEPCSIRSPAGARTGAALPTIRRATCWSST